MAGRILRLSAGLVAAMALLPGLAAAATIKVNVTTDGLNGSDQCSLREAVESANTNSAVGGCAKGQNSKRDTIELRAQDYTLSIPSSNEGNNVDGDLDVKNAGPLTVTGKGRNDTTITQSQNDRVFDVVFSAGLTLNSLRMTSGDVTSFTPANARGGNARVTNGKLTLNKVGSTSGDALVGGSVHASGSNTKLTINRSFFETNDASGSGGTLAVQSGAKATVKRTLIQLSEVDDATNSGSGGIILSEGLGGLTILDSTLQGSSAETTGIANAALGGAIYSNAPLTIRRSTIRGNTVSADQDNTQERGGGVYVAGDQANIVNSTFFDNRAGGPGDNDGLGGAVYAASGTTHIKHVTFDSNQGSDDADSIGGGSGVADFFGSIIDDAGDPCEGSFVSSVGFNVTNSNDPDCALLGSDVPDGDADLDVFGDNGGFTETIPIAGTSDAKNLVPKVKCKTATGLEDQRGFVRPRGKKCDAGAFELGAKKN
jgi:CSLREA domain-containing protein